MCVENEVRARIEAKRHPLRLDVRDGARLPEEQVAVRIEYLRLDANLHAAKTGAGLGFALARGTGAIDENVGMMHEALVAGTNLNRFDPTRALDGNRKNKIPICVRALGWKSQRLEC